MLRLRGRWSLKSSLIGLLGPSDDAGFVAGIAIKIAQWPLEFNTISENKDESSKIYLTLQRMYTSFEEFSQNPSKILHTYYTYLFPFLKE